MRSLSRVLLVGCGYTGLEVARQARARGLSVLATTRSQARAAELAEAGATPLVLDALSYSALVAHVDGSTALVVTFPPDGHSDEDCASLVRSAFGAVYVSSTGVYGRTHGVIDDSTPVNPDTARNVLRVSAEDAWRGAGATVLRVAAIYGPGRGQHERVRSGSARIAGDGSHHVCRIHVEDLARAILAAIDHKLGARSFVLADDQPAQQGEVIRYLAQLLGVPTPAAVPLEAAPETLRHDRQVDASGFKQAASFAFRYPSYQRGFPACLAAEAASSEPEPLA